MVRLYARALKGDRADGARPKENRENITLIGAIAWAGFVGAMTFDGSTNVTVPHLPENWYTGNLTRSHQVFYMIVCRKYSFLLHKTTK